MKFRVPGLLGGRTYPTWEDAKNNCEDVNDITVELNGSEYVNLHNTYYTKIELLKNQTTQLKDMLDKKDFEYQQNINKLESDLQKNIERNTSLLNEFKKAFKNKSKECQQKTSELSEKDRRCASLAAAVNRLKGKKQKGGVV